MVNGVAPACPIVRSQTPPAAKRQLIPPIRRATSENTMDTVNQIKDVLDQVLHNPNQPEWVEVQRITQRVRIHNPNDFDQWVEVERITRVVFQNKITEARLEWNYRPR